MSSFDRPSEVRKHLASLRRRRDLLKVRVDKYVGGDPHPTRRELRAITWALSQLEDETRTTERAVVEAAAFYVETGDDAALCDAVATLKRAKS